MEQYNDLLFQYTGLKETSKSPQILEEAMLITVDEAVFKFLQDESKNLSEVDSITIKTKYENFKRTLPSFGQANTYDKLNVLSIFAASIFEFYLFSKEGMLKRMREETTVLLQSLQTKIDYLQSTFDSANERNIDEINIEIYILEKNKKKIENSGGIFVLLKEKTRLFNDIFSCETYEKLYEILNKNSFFYFLQENSRKIHNDINWTVVIRRGATALSTIMLAFCKKIFFAGLQTKETFAHDGILTPLTYLKHETVHIAIFSNTNFIQYEYSHILSGTLRYDHTLCSQFIQFIQNKYERDEESLNFLYIFLFAYLFENIDQFDTIFMPLGNKTFWADVFCFTISLDVFLFVYDVVCKAENNFFAGRMTSPYDLQGILPSLMKDKEVTNDYNDYKILVKTYNKQCVLLFLQNYYEFVVSILKKQEYIQNGIVLNCINGESTKKLPIEDTSSKIPSSKGGKRTKKGRNKKSKKKKRF